MKLDYTDAQLDLEIDVQRGLKDRQRTIVVQAEEQFRTDDRRLRRLLAERHRRIVEKSLTERHEPVQAERVPLVTGHESIHVPAPSPTDAWGVSPRLLPHEETS